MIHILHITNSYGGTSVYKNLYTQLDRLGIRQTVFVPLNYRNRNRLGNHLIDFKTLESQIIYSTKLMPWHRILYMAKIHKIVKEIYAKVDVSSVDIIHASTLCVDGAAAYFISKKYKIPYISAIRDTDVNVYYKIFIWRKFFYSEILKAADKVIFISPVYKTYFLQNVISVSLSNSIKQKVEIIPNGIDIYFLNHRRKKNKGIDKYIQLIYISAFTKRKGLAETIKAVDILRGKGYNMNLLAIGKGLPHRTCDEGYIKYVEQLSFNKPWIQLESYMNFRELCEAFAHADIFVMPSKHETFGLVYVEALSQCIPIVYSKGEGFDGFYPEGIVGYPAEAGNVDNIAETIERIIQNYQIISENISHLKLTETFSWEVIAGKYKSIYEDML